MQVVISWGCSFSLGVVVKADGRVLLLRDCFRSLAQGAKAGTGGADGGEYSQNAEDYHDPHAKAEFILQPDCQNQEKQCGKDDGKAELTYPHQEIQKLHSSSALGRRLNTPSNYTLLYPICSRVSRQICEQFGKGFFGKLNKLETEKGRMGLFILPRML